MAFNWFGLKNETALPAGRDVVSLLTGLPEDAKTDLARCVQVIMNAPNRKDREYLLFGWCGPEERRIPVLVHRSLLFSHAYGLGGPGSGKSSFLVTSVVTCQLIHHRRYDPETGQDLGPFCAIVIIDCKGDHACFQTAAIEAARAGRSFRYFTNQVGKSTFVYDRFSGLQDGSMSVRQVAETILQSLGLNHGAGFGRSYYSRRARQWLTRAFQQNDVRSFEDLYLLAMAETDREVRRETFELLSVIESLASLPQLNAPHPYAIRMPHVLAEAEVVYFWLPAAKELATVREIGALALYDLFQHATTAQPALAVVDEFQIIVGSNISTVMEQSRDRVGLVLLNQTLSGLRNQDADLREAVWGMTALKQVFSVTDLEGQKYVSAVSGTRTERTYSYQGLQRGVVRGLDEERPYIAPNDLLAMNRDPYSSLLFVERAKGEHTPSDPHPFFVQPVRAFSEDVFAVRNDPTVWPEPSAATIVALAQREPDTPPEDRFSDQVYTDQVFTDEAGFSDEAFSDRGFPRGRSRDSSQGRGNVSSTDPPAAQTPVVPYARRLPSPATAKKGRAKRADATKNVRPTGDAPGSQGTPPRVEPESVQARLRRMKAEQDKKK